MSENKITLPTFDDARSRVSKGKANELDKLIYIFQPFIPKHISLFREHLEKAIQYVIDSQGSFGLTLHAPDPATQDALVQDIIEIIWKWFRDEMTLPDLERALRERLGG